MKRSWGKRRAGDSGHPLFIGLGGLAAGSALAYWGDPERGGRRRAEVRQKAIHFAKELAWAAGIAARDLEHRALGIWAGANAWLEEVAASARGQREDDAVIAERVRARLGRLCSHPSAIEVTVEDGCVELKGPIFASEREQVLRGAATVRGVEAIDDDLQPHETDDGLTMLQGRARSQGARPVLLQERWSPAARVLAGIAGVGMAGWGAARRSALGAGAGLVLLVRSMTNLSARRLFGVSAGGLVALEAARTLPDIDQVALYEPALLLAGNTRQVEWLPRFDAELARGRVGAAMVTSMIGLELAPPAVNLIPRRLLEALTNLALKSEDRKAGPGEVTMRMLAPTLHYDGHLIAELRGTLDRFREVPAEVLLLGGSKGLPFIRPALDALERVLPHVSRVELPGLDHGGSSDATPANRGGRPDLVAPLLKEFFTRAAGPPR